MKEAVANMTELKQISTGELQGEPAITALRKALQQIYIAEADIAEYRRLVSAAELKLIYGDEGRPQRLSSTFIEGAG